MIDFSFSEEQKMLRQTVHDFSLKEIRPKAPLWDKEADPVKAFDMAFEVTKKGLHCIYCDWVITQDITGHII